MRKGGRIEINMGFLIHYGWRGTTARKPPVPKKSTFLIHYGWRETSSG